MGMEGVGRGGQGGASTVVVSVVFGGRQHRFTLWFFVVWGTCYFIVVLVFDTRGTRRHMALETKMCEPYMVCTFPSLRRGPVKTSKYLLGRSRSREWKAIVGAMRERNNTSCQPTVYKQHISRHSTNHLRDPSDTGRGVLK